MLIIPLIFNIGGPEVILIVLVLLLLFGGKKIPELMKGLGKGVKSFKDGMNDVQDKINADSNSSEGKTAEEDQNKDSVDAQKKEP
jgi:sec-independent protein translocase protein TatA